MIITHLPQPTALQPPYINDTTACDGLKAQVVDKTTYDFIKGDLMASRLIHHLIVTDDEQPNCADCADILAE